MCKFRHSLPWGAVTLGLPLPCPGILEVLMERHQRKKAKDSLSNCSVLCPGSPGECKEAPTRGLEGVALLMALGIGPGLAFSLSGLRLHGLSASSYL